MVLVFVPGRYNRDVEAILTHAGRSVDRSTATADLLTQLRADLGEQPHRSADASASG
jgi:hypothetical protein